MKMLPGVSSFFPLLEADCLSTGFGTDLDALDPFSAIKGVVDVVSGTTMFPTSTSVSTVTSPSPSSLGGSSTSTSTVTVTKVVTAIPSSCLNSSKTTKTTKTTKTAKSSKTTKATSPTKT